MTEKECTQEIQLRQRNAMQWLKKCFLDCNDQLRSILDWCNEYQLEGKAKVATWHRQPNLEAGGREKLSHKPWQKIE